MNYIFVSDILWYSGHILTGISILLSKNYYYLAVSCVFFGQFVTIISRPISRLHSNTIDNKKLDTNDENESNV